MALSGPGPAEGPRSDGQLLAAAGCGCPPGAAPARLRLRMATRALLVVSSPTTCSL